jgi:hypothetical protein
MPKTNTIPHLAPIPSVSHHLTTLPSLSLSHFNPPLIPSAPSSYVSPTSTQLILPYSFPVASNHVASNIPLLQLCPTAKPQLRPPSFASQYDWLTPMQSGNCFRLSQRPPQRPGTMSAEIPSTLMVNVDTILVAWWQNVSAAASERREERFRVKRRVGRIV